MSRLPISAALPFCVLAGVALAQVQVNPSSRALEDFGRRVAAYVKVRDNVESEIHGLKPTRTAKDIERHEQRMARGIRRARRGTVQGSIFTPEISTRFRLLIAETMHGPKAARIQESLKVAEPVEIPPIRANDSCPPGIPLQSTPPSLLANLPPLPHQLEYRLLGRNLILLDTGANLIVDFVANALP